MAPHRQRLLRGDVPDDQALDVRGGGPRGERAKWRSAAASIASSAAIFTASEVLALLEKLVQMERA